MSKARVFVSYSHRDEEEKVQLVEHLGVLEREGLLNVWVDDQIGAGGDWRAEIGSAISEARVALLLITRHFLNSDFILGTEVPELLQRRYREGLRVFPVIAKPCAWKRVKWLAALNVKPRNGAPVWRDQGRYADEELAAIAEEVAAIIGGGTSPSAGHGLPEPELVMVESGPFLMGTEPGPGTSPSEAPRHRVSLPDYRIGKYPVTNREYAAFLEATGGLPPVGLHWFGTRPPSEKLDHPVVGVSWHDSVAYCEWLSDRTGLSFRLPSEAEWEKAARGHDGRDYPWGDGWEPGRCNHGTGGTTPVTAHPDGKSTYGCFDLVGNAAEWTRSLWGEDYRVSDFPYPYRPGDGREDLEAPDTLLRIFRGGSYADEPRHLRCAARRFFLPDKRDPRRGFRISIGS